MRVIEREEVARRLTYEMCIPIVRRAMIAFSRGETKQLLRSIVPLSEGRLLGIMPGAMQKIRTLESIVVWGRSRDRAHTFAERIQAELAVPVAAAGAVREAVAQ